MPQELIDADPERFGNKPTTLEVMFPSDDIADVLDAYYERYAGARGDKGGILTLRCDGETFTEIPKNVNEAPVTGKCRRPMPEVGKKWPECSCGASPKGRLKVMLMHAPVGIYQITLGGHTRLEQLFEDLSLGKAQFGRLLGIPFDLVRRREVSTVPDKEGNRLPKEGFPVRVVSRFTLQQAMLARGIDPFALEAGKPAMLAAPEPDDAIIDDEDVDEVIDDISMCFKLAKDVGVSAEDYTLYVTRKYPAAKGQANTVDELAGSDAIIKAECEMLRRNEAGLRDRILAKVAMLRVEKK